MYTFENLKHYKSRHKIDSIINASVIHADYLLSGNVRKLFIALLDCTFPINLLAAIYVVKTRCNLMLHYFLTAHTLN